MAEASEAYWEAAYGGRRYDHPVVKFFAEQRIRDLGRVLDWTEIDSALDVGCGSGFSTFYMHEKIPDIKAIDASPALLKMHPLPHLTQLGDIMRLPFDDGAFSLVYAWECLHHLADDDAACGNKNQFGGGGRARLAGNGKGQPEVCPRGRAESPESRPTGIFLFRQGTRRHAAVYPGIHAERGRAGGIARKGGLERRVDFPEQDARMDVSVFALVALPILFRNHQLDPG